MVTGHCLCGFVVYEYGGAVGPAGYCHCEDCRRRSGSAFGISIRAETPALRIVRGQVKVFTKSAESGVLLSRSFCPQCGSALFTHSASHPEYTYIQAGSLDDPAVVEPKQQSWLRSAVSWRTIDNSLPKYDKGRPT